ncbi:MAG: translation initiation factor IF-3 [Candidatus Zixiibacteriota bacterium]
MTTKSIRVNDRIRISPVRLVGEDGTQIGIVPIKEALDRARALSLDLVEVSPDSRPPVCRIMDYGKYKYELAKKDKLAKKKAHAFQLKEMRFRPKIDEHDYQFKMKHVREFLLTGSKVRVFVLFRGREMTRLEFGQKVLERLGQDLADIAVIDVPAKLEGRSMGMVLTPRPEVVRQAQAAKAQKAKEKEQEKLPPQADEPEPEEVEESNS